MSIEKHVTTARILQNLAQDSESTRNQYAVLGFLEILERSKKYGSSVSEFGAVQGPVSQSLIEHAEGLYEDIIEMIEDDFCNDIDCADGQ